MAPASVAIDARSEGLGGQTQVDTTAGDDLQTHTCTLAAAPQDDMLSFLITKEFITDKDNI